MKNRLILFAGNHDSSSFKYRFSVMHGWLKTPYYVFFLFLKIKNSLDFQDNFQKIAWLETPLVKLHLSSVSVTTTQR